MVKVVVKAMEEARAQADAIGITCDQFQVSQIAAGVDPQRGRDKNREGKLTRSRTKESFARDWYDRLLSEYRFG